MRKELIEFLDSEEFENILNDRARWKTLLIDKYPPVIHRLYTQISPTRTLILHKMFNAEGQECLMHSHSWDFALKVVEGGYEMGIGFSEDRNSPPETVCQMQIKEGDVYEMTSENVWHYTKPLENKVSYSIMLIGPRKRERRAENNSPLTARQKNEMMDFFLSYLDYQKTYKEDSYE